MIESWYKMNETNAWLDMITKLYTHLHESDVVMHTSKESTKKRERIYRYFERLERVHKKVASSKHKSSELMLKKFYYDIYVVKPENIPDSYFEKEKRIRRERGYGDIELTSERKEMLIDQLISDQKESLDKWIEYFLYDEESKSYEIWEKYWVFQGLQKLGKFDKEKMKFLKRDKTTIYPFPPVEREAIFNTLKLMEDYIKGKHTEEEIKNALGSGNFKALYEYSLKQMLLKGDRQNKTTEGKWIKYDQGSDYNILRNSLQGYYTGWCTAAGENFAKSQLENGDFYVYYSMDEHNEAKVPRIAIRMNGKNNIGEIRGIAEEQNMEPEMIPILNKKLEEFSHKDKFLKKEYDIQFLTFIDKKIQKNLELSIDELKFLYEVDDKIEGFGYQEDPRIEEIKQKRNICLDLSRIFNYKEDEISILKEDVLNGKKLEYFYGDLYLRDLTTPENLILPKKISGDLVLDELTTAEGLILPEEIGGDLVLDGLTTVKNLVLPKEIGGNLDLGSLITAENLTLPEKVGGYLALDVLTTAKDIVFPKEVGCDLYLDGLSTVKDLVLPEKVDGYLYLRGLTTDEDLILPKNFDLDKLCINELFKEKIEANPDKYYKHLEKNVLNNSVVDDTNIKKVR